MTSVVTGADGFVGRALCARLAAEGEIVRKTVRATVGDIEKVADWSRTVEGAEVVYHLAARVHVISERDRDPSAAYRRTNVDATMKLARAAAAAGVRHFVFVSSVKAAAERSGAEPLVETDPPHPEDDYGRSKLEAEQQLDELRRSTSMHISILRPPLVYGPAVKANFYRLMHAVDHFVPLPLGRIRNRRSLVYVENLVDAMRNCVAAGAASSRLFYVSDGEDLSTPELVRRLATALHRPPLLLPVPVSCLRMAAAMLGRAGSVERLTSSLAIDTHAIRDALHWTPPFTSTEGLRATAAWYKQSR